MGLFKKKPDPITERARSLNEKIAALEAEIQKLSEQEARGKASPFSAPAAAPASSAHAPRLRSTALPRGLGTPAAAAPEPIFEEVDQRRIHQPPGEAGPAPAPELGTRKFDLGATCRRFVNNFRGPATSNPKLVSYLAAGSIQGLRPMRYEKRVARNRFIALVIVLAVVVVGLIAIFLRNR